MTIFSQGNRVLYINNIQFLRPRVREIGAHAFRKRLARKFRSMIKPFFRADKNLFVYSPFILPYYGSTVKKRFNESLLRMQVRFLQRFLKLRNPIVWIENPIGITVAKSLNPALVLYFMIDKYECHSELRNPQEIVDLDNRLTREADLILCVSLKLYEEKLTMRKEGVYYMPHGVDFEHFHKATKPLPLPEDVNHIRHPMVGYFGSLDAKNDDSIIHYCATRRPDLSFILIGETVARPAILRNLPNVYFLGYKEYEQLPNYGKAFDVCIMFWKVNDWIQHCHPVKTMEYLAMGKPVVSVAFDEVMRKYAGMVRIANNQEEFLKKIEEEIAHDSKEKQQARLDFVKNETWESRAEYISRIIAKDGNRSGHALQ
jgi:glycosyltransferase involved in cell wall biosynthesis